MESEGKKEGGRLLVEFARASALSLSRQGASLTGVSWMGRATYPVIALRGVHERISPVKSGPSMIGRLGTNRKHGEMRRLWQRLSPDMRT